MDYDTIIIGAGSAGVRSARLLASAGEQVLLIESAEAGGTCVNSGCVPKKLMVNAVKFSHDIEKARGNGWDIGDTSFHWNNLKDKIKSEISRLNSVYSDMLKKSGVNLINGHASFIDNTTVEVNGTQFNSRNIIIATGGKPNKLSVPGGHHAITSDEFFSIDSIPENVIIVGNGYIGIEFAGILKSLGSNVTVVGNHTLPIKGFDTEIRTHLKQSMSSSGIKFTTGKVVAIDKISDGFNVVFDDDTVLKTNLVIAAVGRHPNIDGLKLENTTVTVKNGKIILNDKEEYWCNFENTISAIGDVANDQNLTPVATSQAKNLFNMSYRGEWTVPDFENVPKAVFYTYPVASCGLTEDETKKLEGTFKVYRSHFTPMSQAFSENKTKTFMKMIVRCIDDDEIVVGVHMFGEDAPEIIQGMALAVVNELTKDQVDRTIGIHPTSAEEFVTMR